MRALIGACFAALVLILLAVWPVAAEERAVPRVVIGLLEGGPQDQIRDSRLHQMVQMPLEHLGLKMEYHRLEDGLPDLTGRDDVRGIVSWFTSTEHHGALDLLTWFEAAIADGRKVVFLGELGVSGDPGGAGVPYPRIDALLRRLGVTSEGTVVAYPGDAAYFADTPGFWGFEHSPPRALPFPVFSAVGEETVTHVSVGWTGPESVRSAIVVTAPNGGMIAPEHAAEIDPFRSVRRWLVNPFEFLRHAFATDDLPKPDTTTLAGRRIYYSHVDGDGWRSVSEVRIDERPAMAAEVLMDRVIKRYPDLPVTIAPIAAELDPAWLDNPEARRLAAEIMALPQVEAGSHTYSHPFQWSFFQDYEAAREAEILNRLGVSLGAGDTEAFGTQLVQNEAGGAEVDAAGNPVELNERYSVPRAFDTQPFTVEREVQGSMDRISAVGGKRVEVLQWSGDTTPFEAVVRATREAGIPNINGGDTRFDSDFRSYGFVAPIGRPVGRELQVLASMSNENTYTDLWRDRFFGFRHLLETIENTGRPIRVKPINVYYHSYSAERIAALNALLEVLSAIRSLEVAPITTSAFARVAQGFYSARLVALEDGRWRVVDRGALQTIRFDRASLKTVDFVRSEGVLGERSHQGSLYIALDPASDTPVIALKPREDLMDLPAADRPYLMESRWPVTQLTQEGAESRAQVQGFGPLAATWVVPEPGSWEVALLLDGREVAEAKVTVGEDRRLPIRFDEAFDPGRRYTLVLEREGA